MDVIELARAHTPMAIKTLADIASNDEAPPAARVAASEALLSRGWGKPTQPLEATGNSTIELHLVAARVVSSELLKTIAAPPTIDGRAERANGQAEVDFSAWPQPLE